MSKTKVGIVGCGGIATGKHLPAISKNKDVEIVAFCDLIKEKAEDAAKKYGVEDAKVFTDYKELIKLPEIEAVYVLTPNRSHSFITVDALEAGKHVMCEKPMAINSAEAKKMVDAAKRTGKLLTIGYQNRYTAKARALKEYIDDGKLGEIYRASAHAIRRRAVPTWGVFLNEYEQGGGPLIDIGTHALDLTLYMMNNYKPKRVLGQKFRKLADTKNAANAWGPWDPEKFTVEDSCFGFIVFENGAVVNVDASWALNTLDVYEASTEVCGTLAGATTKEGLVINGEENGRLYTLTPELSMGGVAYFDGAGAMSEADIECATFINAIRTGSPLVVKPEQAYVVTQILEAIYLSADEGRAVEFDDNGEIIR